MYCIQQWPYKDWKIVQLHEKDIIGKQKNGKYKDGKGIDNDNWADNGKHNDEDKDK